MRQLSTTFCFRDNITIKYKKRNNSLLSYSENISMCSCYVLIVTIDVMKEIKKTGTLKACST